MFGAILKATNTSFQKGMTFRSIYVKKVMKLLAFIFEQPSYLNILSIDMLMIGRILQPDTAKNTKTTTTKQTNKQKTNYFLRLYRYNVPTHQPPDPYS